MPILCDDVHDMMENINFFRVYFVLLVSLTDICCCSCMKSKIYMDPSIEIFVVAIFDIHLLNCNNNNNTEQHKNMHHA